MAARTCAARASRSALRRRSSRLSRSTAAATSPAPTPTAWSSSRWAGRAEHGGEVGGHRVARQRFPEPAERRLDAVESAAGSGNGTAASTPQSMSAMACAPVSWRAPRSTASRSGVEESSSASEPRLDLAREEGVPLLVLEEPLPVVEGEGAGAHLGRVEHRRRSAVGRHPPPGPARGAGGAPVHARAPPRGARRRARRPRARPAGRSPARSGPPRGPARPAARRGAGPRRESASRTSPAVAPR